MSRLHGDEVSVGIVLDRLGRDTVGLGQMRFQRPVGVDDRRAEVVDRTSDDSRIQLLDLELLWIIDDVLGRRQNAGFGFLFDGALVLQQPERSPLVAGIVRHPDYSAFRKIRDGMDFTRI